MKDKGSNQADDRRRKTEGRLQVPGRAEEDEHRAGVGRPAGQDEGDKETKEERLRRVRQGDQNTVDTDRDPDVGQRDTRVTEGDKHQDYRVSDAGITGQEEGCHFFFANSGA